MRYHPAVVSTFVVTSTFCPLEKDFHSCSMSTDSVCPVVIGPPEIHFWPLLEKACLCVCALLPGLLVSLCWRHCRAWFPHVTTNQCLPRFSPAKAKWIWHWHRSQMLHGWPLEHLHHSLDHLCHLHRSPSSTRRRRWRPSSHLVKSKKPTGTVPVRSPRSIGGAHRTPDRTGFFFPPPRPDRTGFFLLPLYYKASFSAVFAFCVSQEGRGNHNMCRKNFTYVFGLGLVLGPQALLHTEQSSCHFYHTDNHDVTRSCLYNAA